ncbi:unnamed protein product [Candida verbasci]|uniref:Uncharacterized protein n=1 Tax=Candida verbasci TaxID=1227364 RepID=A0A9W4TST5_9ASCO|nr:unnamed protein product [Candida verbasci]
MSKIVVRKPNFLKRSTTTKFDASEDEYSLENIQLGIASVNFDIEKSKIDAKKLPKVIHQPGLRFNYLSLAISESEITPIKYLRNLHSSDRALIEFACGFRFEILSSIDRMVNFINGLGNKKYENKKFGQDFICFIIGESSMFIHDDDSKFDKDLIEGFLYSIYSDFDVIQLVKNLEMILKGGKFKGLKKGISDSMVAAFNLYINPCEGFENDLIARLITLWIFALLNIN